MDVLYRHTRWGVLIRACPQARPTAAESVKHNDKLERWKPYKQNGLELAQTAAQHTAAAFKVVAPMVIQVMMNGNSFDPNDVREDVAGRFSGDTARFNHHNSETSTEEMVFEAVERIAVLCFALKHAYPLNKNGKQNSDKILLDTLKIEMPHLDRLAEDLPGFRDEFWPEEISIACKKFIAEPDFAAQEYNLEQAAE